MLLTIDVGNTNLTLGLYEGDEPGPRWRLATNHERMPDEYGLQFVGLLSHEDQRVENISGICRFYLQQVSPTFKFYVSPINSDPSDSYLRITEPPEFIKEISSRLGLFYTTGVQ